MNVTGLKKWVWMNGLRKRKHTFDEFKTVMLTHGIDYEQLIKESTMTPEKLSQIQNELYDMFPWLKD